MCHNVTNAHTDQIFLELRLEVKDMLIQKQCVTTTNTKMYIYTKLGFMAQIIKKLCSEHNFLRNEARGQRHSDLKQYATLCDPKMY